MFSKSNPIDRIRNLPASNLIKSEADLYKNVPWYVKFASKILTSANTPQHVAFIMDGNRRFARTKLNTQNVLQGHTAGFDKLCEILIWCRILKIEHVSVYAFSTENFKRSETEVSGLLKLFNEKLDDLCGENDQNLEKLTKNDIKINFVGQIDRLPLDLKAKIGKIHETWENGSKNCSKNERQPKCTLNICLAYTSSEEITTALEKSKNKKSDDQTTFINEFKSNLLIKEPFPELLIRTSGETRLSDFLLFQVFEKTRLEFVKCLWPDLGFFDFFGCVLNWQVFNEN